MKILTVFPSFSELVTGGAGSLLLHLCDELIKMDHQVTLLTNSVGEIWKTSIPKKLKIITTRKNSESTIKNRDFYLLLQHFHAAKMFKWMNNSYDIINIHNYPSAIPAALAKNFNSLKIPVVYQCNEPPRFLYDLHAETIRNSNLLKKTSINLATPFLRKLDQWSVGKTDEVVSISKFMQKDLQKIYHKKNTFIMPGIEIDRFRPNISGGEIRKRYCKNGEFLILSSNVLHPRKRIDILIQAMPYVLKKHRNTKVLITGAGPEKARLEKLIHALNLNGNVVLAGFIPFEELPTYYAACDVFVFTAIREPQIGSPAEALASGKPVIAPNDGSPAETIIEGETGFFYKPLDSKDLAEKITWCIENKSYLKKMSKNCRKWVEKNMTWRKMTEETVQVFRRTLENAN